MTTTADATDSSTVEQLVMPSKPSKRLSRRKSTESTLSNRLSNASKPNSRINQRMSAARSPRSGRSRTVSKRSKPNKLPPPIPRRPTTPTLTLTVVVRKLTETVPKRHSIRFAPYRSTLPNANSPPTKSVRDSLLKTFEITPRRYLLASSSTRARSSG